MQNYASHQSGFCLLVEKTNCTADKSKLEWGCPNGTKYPLRQPIPNRAILPNRARLQTDGQGDSSIPPPP